MGSRCGWRRRCNERASRSEGFAVGPVRPARRRRVLPKPRVAVADPAGDLEARPVPLRDLQSGGQDSRGVRRRSRFGRRLTMRRAWRSAIRITPRSCRAFAGPATKRRRCTMPVIGRRARSTSTAIASTVYRWTRRLNKAAADEARSRAAGRHYCPQDRRGELGRPSAACRSYRAPC